MLKLVRFMLIGFVACVGVGTLIAQAPPCAPGTLAQALGTSCSVGDVTFNFQSSFFGVLDVIDQGASTQVPISASDIGFTPVRRDGLVGFQLTTNFVDGPGPDSTFVSDRLVTFSYAPQANPGFDIVEQILALDASSQAALPSSNAVNVSDFQTYANTPEFLTDLASFLGTFVNEQDGAVISGLVSHSNLEVPALLSNGFAGGPTTSLQVFITGSTEVATRSVTLLYRTGPVAPPPLGALTYTNIDLPGASATAVSGIANDGTMTGAYQDAQGVFHGYLTGAQGGFTTIDFPGATATFADGLNNRGDVVGSYTDADGNTHGFLLRDNNFTSLDFPNATFTSAFSINDRGQIVGVYETSDQGVHGFLLDQGQFSTIDHTGESPEVSGAAFTEVFGINNRGEIAGVVFDPFTFRGLLQQNGAFFDVDVPGQTDTNNDFVNDAGDMVGFFSDINQVIHGFRRQSGSFTTVDFPGGIESFPFSVNASGKIVGQYLDAAGNLHSFLAEPGEGQNNAPANAFPANASLLPSGSGSLSAPVRICGSAEWRQHVDQIKLPCATKH